MKDHDDSKIEDADADGDHDFLARDIETFRLPVKAKGVKRDAKKRLIVIRNKKAVTQNATKFNSLLREA